MRLLQNQQKKYVLKYQYEIDHTHVYGDQKQDELLLDR